MSGVPRGVKLLGAVSFFNDVASEMVYPLLPALVVRLGGGALAVGAVDGAAELTSAAVKMVSGRLADRPHWRKRLILLGYLIAVLVRPLIAFASAATQVIGLRMADRIGKGMRQPPRDALIADLTPPAVRGRAFGFHRAADHLGAVAGAVLAWALLAGGTSVHSVISLSIVPGVIAVAVLLAVLRGAGTTRGTGEAGGERNAKDEIGRAFWIPVGALAALTLARIPEALLLLRLQDAGVAVAVLPLVWGGLHVVRSAASYPGGRLADRAGPKAAVAAGGLLTAAVLGMLALSLSPLAAVGTFLLLGVTAGLMEPAERSLVARLAPVRTGRGFGAYHAITGFVALPAALAFGAVYQRVGPASALFASAAAVFISALVWVSVAPREGTA